MGCGSGGRFGWLVARAGRVGRVGLGRARLRWGLLARTGGVVLAVALVGSVLVLSERDVVAQSVPSVGVSAGAAGALEGDVLSFTVTASSPVSGPGGLDVVVSVSEDGDVDVDGDGTVEAGSGVLEASQQGQRTVSIASGELAAVFSVRTAGAAGTGEVRVTATVAPSTGGAYVVDSAATSAAMVVRDDGADVVVFWSGSARDPLLDVAPVAVAEAEDLHLTVRAVSDGAVAPSGFFGVRLQADPGTALPEHYEPVDEALHFGVGSGAPGGAEPFALTGDGARYEAVVDFRFYPTDNDLYEPPVTLDLVLGGDPALPSGVRLGGGLLSRLPVTIINNDYAVAINVEVDPGDGSLSVSWEYSSGAGPYVRQAEVQWRRRGETAWPADGTGDFVTGTSAEITGLDNGVEYEIRVLPVVDDGKADWSDTFLGPATGTPGTTVTMPSVGISAAEAEATEGEMLTFTVRAGEAVGAALDVAVTVVEGGNVDTDGDGVADAASGVLEAAQEGHRVVTIPADATEAMLSVPTVGDTAWEEHATVTVTVSPSVDSAYAVDSSATSASARVPDDDAPEAVVSLSLALFDAVREFDGFMGEEDGGLVAPVTFETAAAQEPRGVYGVHVRTYDGTTRYDYRVFDSDSPVYFGSGAGAPEDSIPFSRSGDGLRFEASATFPVYLLDDGHFELDETFDIALERTAELPASVRLGLADASRTTVTIIDNDLPGVDLDQRDDPPIPGDRQLTLSWYYSDDPNDYVTSYVVRWRRDDVTDPLDDREWESEILVQSAGQTMYGGEESTTIVGLQNGVAYEIGVYPVVDNHSYQLGLIFNNTITGTPGINFEIAGDTSPVFVRGGGVVERKVRLVYDDGTDDAESTNRPQPVPFANRPMGAEVLTGLSAGQSVQCRPLLPPPPNVLRASIVATGDGPRGQCVTDAEGRMTLVYTSVAPSSDSAGDTDHIRVFVDPNGNQQRDSREPSAILAHATRVVRPINYAALGDSYSSGEHGDPNDDRPDDDPFVGEYLDVKSGPRETLVSECRRWSLAYSQVLAFSARSLASSTLPTQTRPAFGDVGFYACAGAVTSEVYVPAAGLVFSGQSELLDGFDDALFSDRMQRADMVTITIGGNDLGFAGGLKDCLTPGLSQCDEGSLSISFDELSRRVGLVISGLMAAAPQATIIVLGYPHLVPPPDPPPPAGIPPAPSRVERRLCDALTLESVADAVNNPTQVVDDSGFSWGQFFVQLVRDGVGLDAELAGFLELAIVTPEELQFLRDAAQGAHVAIRDIAAVKGVFYVDVITEFEEHYPCGDGEDWIYGVVGETVARSGKVLPSSDRSFHPNAAGQRAYADILRRFIDEKIAGASSVTRAGLPHNPAPCPSCAGGRPLGGRSVGGGSDSSAPSPSSVKSSEDEASSDGATAGGASTPVAGYLWARRVVPAASACAARFGPGDRVEFFAEGFAPDSAVTVSVVGATVPMVGSDAAVTALVVPPVPVATADADGRIEVVWTVPDAPAPDADAAPRVYVAKATGTNTSAAAFVAYPVRPLVVYPGAAPCAAADTAATSLGQPVRIAVLDNDTAPSGGSLDPSTVVVDGASGGSFAVDASDGSLTFTPDRGFAGTVKTRYWVYDTWRMGVGAAVTVTVDAGCTITGAAGATVIEGTAGDDVICVGDPDDWDEFHVIDAKAGDDVIIGGDGVDWIYGGAGADVVYGRDGADRIDGGAGVDTVHGGDGFDTILSGDLDDTIVDDADGYELLLAAPSRPANSAPVVGDDKVYAAQGETRDVAVLGNDDDPDGNLVAASLSITTAPTLGEARVVVSVDGEVVVRYVAGSSDGVDSLAYQVCDTLDECSTAQVTVTVGTSHCTILGTEGDDVLRGTPGPDVICGLGGDDVINGIGGDDILIGGPGDDTLTGGNGDDVLQGGSGNDTLTGGAGADTLRGGPGDDTLAGNTQNDTLVGGAGGDSLNGGGGDDVLWAGAGDDTVIGHAGNDVLHGGPGDDTMDDSLAGGNGDDVLFGGPGGDTLTGGAGEDILWGGPGDDALRGNTQNDTLHGGPGDDTLHGGGGDDQLLGGPGGDTLNGNAGDDRLWGNTGGDTLDGGNGVDYADGGEDTDTCRRGETTTRCEA